MQQLESLFEHLGSDDSEHSEAEETIETQLLEAVKSRLATKVRSLCQKSEVDFALRVKGAQLAIEWNSKAETPNAGEETVEILRLLLEENLGEQSFDEKDRNALLRVAVHEKEIGCLKYLVARLTLDVNCKDKNGFTPLYDAVRTGWAEGMEFLLEKNADMTIVNGGKHSANETGGPGACAVNLQDRTARRKNNMKRPNTTRKNVETRQEAKTVIQLAVGLKPSKDAGRSAGDLLNMFRTLVETARRVDDKDKILNVCNLDKKTPLFIAVLSQNLKYVKILLKAGADMTLLDKDNRSVLHWASEHREPKIMEALLKHRAREIKRIQTEIKEKIKDEKQAKIDAENEAETNAKNEAERLPAKTKRNVVTLPDYNLLQKLKRLPMQKCTGKFEGNPLLLTVFCGDIKNTELLMNEGSDSIFEVANVFPGSQVKNYENCNVLHLASLSKNAEVIRYFGRNLGNKTPAKCARQTLYHDLRVLTRKNTKFNEYTPLHLAIMTKQVEFVYALIAAGSDLSAECYNETTQCKNTAMYMLIYQMPPSLMMMTGILDRAIKKDKNNVSVEIDFTVLMAANDWQDHTADDNSSNTPRTKDAGQNPRNKDQSTTLSADNKAVGPTSQNAIDEDQSETAFNGDPRRPAPSHSTAVNIDGDVEVIEPLLGDTPDNKSIECIQDVPILNNEFLSLPVKHENKFAVLNALLETGNLLEQRQHLQHPLVESFLYLYWKRLQGPYAILVFLHVAFAFIITLTIIFNLVHENLTTARVLGCIAFIIMTMIFFQGLQSLNAQDACKLYLAESLTKLVGFYLATKVVRHSYSSHIILVLYDAALFVMILLHMVLLIYTQRKKEQRVWGSWTIFLPVVLVGCFLLAVNFLLPYSPHDSSAFAILLVWFEVLLLVSRIPHYGYYMLMFIEVAFSYLKLLVSFLFIIVGFTLVFMLIFRARPPFDASLPALMKTIVMMNNEFEYNTLSETILSNNLTETDQSSSAGEPFVNLNISEFFKLRSTYEKPSFYLNLLPFSQVTAMVFFIIFIVSVGLVMTNIFVGVAVNDIQKLQIISKQIEFLGSFDQFLLGKPFFGPRGLTSAMFEGMCLLLGRLGMKETVERWKSYKIIGRFYSLDGSNQKNTNTQKQPLPPLQKETPLENASVSGCSTESTPVDETKILHKMKFPKKLKSAIIAKGYANREQQEQKNAIYEKETKDDQRAKAKQKAKAKEIADIENMSKDIAKIKEQLVNLSALTSELLMAMRQENQDVASSL